MLEQDPPPPPALQGWSSYVYLNGSGVGCRIDCGHIFARVWLDRDSTASVEEFQPRGAVEVPVLQVWLGGKNRTSALCAAGVNPEYRAYELLRNFYFTSNIVAKIRGFAPLGNSRDSLLVMSPSGQ